MSWHMEPGQQQMVAVTCPSDLMFPQSSAGDHDILDDPAFCVGYRNEMLVLKTEEFQC